MEKSNFPLYIERAGPIRNGNRPVTSPGSKATCRYTFFLLFFTRTWPEKGVCHYTIVLRYKNGKILLIKKSKGRKRKKEFWTACGESYCQNTCRNGMVYTSTVLVVALVQWYLLPWYCGQKEFKQLQVSPAYLLTCCWLVKLGWLRLIGERFALLTMTVPPCVDAGDNNKIQNNNKIKKQAKHSAFLFFFESNRVAKAGDRRPAPCLWCIRDWRRGRSVSISFHSHLNWPKE